MSAAGRFPRQVWLLGWASLLTDAATEIIYPLLPAYLARVLGAGAASLGVIEGVAEGVNSTLKVVSGRLADRRSRRRTLVIGGYTLSSLARPCSPAWRRFCSSSYPSIVPPRRGRLQAPSAG